MIQWNTYWWEIGMPWGDHHPDPVNRDWYGRDAVKTDAAGRLNLDILYKPCYFDDIRASRLYCSGCISSTATFGKGYYRFEYRLPLGRNIWPAIWLCGVESWPPEIDIMEGWTGSCRRDYRRCLPWKNNIFPTVHYKEGYDNKVLSLHDGLFAGTLACRQPFYDRCVCELVWADEMIAFWYNNRCVATVTDPNILAALDHPMHVIIDLFCGHDFDLEDFKDYQDNGRKFTIYNFTYQPKDQRP